MRVFIVGATGVYGEALIPRLVARGDTVVALARDVERAAAIVVPGVELVAGDVLHDSREHLGEVMRGCDAAFHLATAIRPGATGPDGANTTAALRTTGTQRLLDAVRAVGVRTYVQQSIVMAYVDGGDRWLDEDTPFEASADRVAMVSPVALRGQVRVASQDIEAVLERRSGRHVGADLLEHGDGDEKQ